MSKKIVNRFGAGLLASAMIAAGAISAGLSPAVAFAGTGYVTIAQKDNTQSPYTYDAFQIVTGDVVNDNGEYKGTHLHWVNNDVKAQIMSFLSSYDSDDAGTTPDYQEFLVTKYGTAWGNLTQDQREEAQNVVEFISERIDQSANDTIANTTPDTKQGDSFAAQLSRQLYTAGLSADMTITQGAENMATMDQGYWLITSTPSAIANGEAGSAPMWVPVSDTALTITEKTAVPTIAKYVKDDATGETWAKLADAGVGEAENLDFKIESSLPQNIDAYATYRAVVTDTLPAGMDFENSNTSSVVVTLAGVDVTDYCTVDVTGRVLTVTIADAKDSANLNNADVLSDRSLVVTYSAHLNGSANIGPSVGNENTAVLTYDADPNSSNVTKSIQSAANVITYSVQLDKVDQVTRIALDDAKFTVSTEIGGTTYYVMSDGTLTTVAADAEEFTTVGGSLTIPRLDEGVYTIHETEAPNSYEVAPDIRLEIQSTISNGALSNLVAVVSGGEGFTSGTVTAASGNNGVIKADTATGEIEFITGDDLVITLPVTGMKIRDAALIGGVIIAGASIAVLVAKKRNQEQE